VAKEHAGEEVEPQMRKERKATGNWSRVNGWLDGVGGRGVTRASTKCFIT
jgi:hypothetical protein